VGSLYATRTGRWVSGDSFWNQGACTFDLGRNWVNLDRRTVYRTTDRLYALRAATRDLHDFVQGLRGLVGVQQVQATPDPPPQTKGLPVKTLLLYYQTGETYRLYFGTNVYWTPYVAKARRFSSLQELLRAVASTFGNTSTFGGVGNDYHIEEHYTETTVVNKTRLLV
jgi:hypothetical protein